MCKIQSSNCYFVKIWRSVYGINKMLLDGFCSHRFGRKAGKERERGKCPGTYLVVQQLRFHAPNAGDLGSIPGQGTRSHMLQ